MRAGRWRAGCTVRHSMSECATLRVSVWLFVFKEFVLLLVRCVFYSFMGGTFPRLFLVVLHVFVLCFLLIVSCPLLLFFFVVSPFPSFVLFFFC